jgi:hypothetical protein
MRFEPNCAVCCCHKVEYIWLCDQLKALRQDLVVQHVKNEFTIGVYECHARVALEEGDMNEYNQVRRQPPKSCCPFYPPNTRTGMARCF